MTMVHDPEEEDRLFATGSDGHDLYPSCVLTVDVDGQPPVQLSGKRIRLVLAGSARRVIAELEADNTVSLVSHVLHDDSQAGGPLPEYQELAFRAAAVY